VVGGLAASEATVTVGTTAGWLRGPSQAEAEHPGIHRRRRDGRDQPAGPIHVLVAADIEGDNVRIITAYRPDPSEWEADLRTRRKKS
jgi:hypothetical protein